MADMATKTVESLKMSELHADPNAVKRYNSLFELVKDMTITDALKVIEGMPAEIDSYVADENRQRKLSDLKTNFL